MALWGKNDQANNAPKFVTNSGNGNTGIQDYGSEVIMVLGTEGYPVPPGWARRYTKGDRTIWESLISFAADNNGGILNFNNENGSQYTPLFF